MKYIIKEFKILHVILLHFYTVFAVKYLKNT